MVYIELGCPSLHLTAACFGRHVKPLDGKHAAKILTAPLKKMIHLLDSAGLGVLGLDQFDAASAASDRALPCASQGLPDFLA